jgi:hypothetical protein
MILVLIFLCGAIYEAACVGFVHFSERGQSLRTALCSMLAISVELTGIITSVRDWHQAPVFVAGFGCGSFLAVWWKARK